LEDRLPSLSLSGVSINILPRDDVSHYRQLTLEYEANIIDIVNKASLNLSLGYLSGNKVIQLILDGIFSKLVYLIFNLGAGVFPAFYHEIIKIIIITSDV
jgi:hypothetical protein